MNDDYLGYSLFQKNPIFLHDYPVTPPTGSIVKPTFQSYINHKK
jgi:hypothetical protein